VDREERVEEREEDMTRKYPTRPMVGVGATILRGDHVLIVQRGREPAYGKWSLPGGLVELGESLHDAICREVLEEANLKVAVVDVVAVLDRVLRDDDGRVEYHYILVDFLCRCDVGEPLPGTDVLACCFVPVSNLGRYPLTSGTLVVVQKALSMTQGSHLPIYDRTL
jgi:8-oxo-dGTP diphosphatase